MHPDRLNGAKPLSPDSLLKRSIRPALERAGIVGKQIGWHNSRHSLATNLRAMGVDVKVPRNCSGMPTPGRWIFTLVRCPNRNETPTTGGPDDAAREQEKASAPISTYATKFGA